MSLREDILAAALQQLDKNTKAVSDGAWVDSLISELKTRSAALPANTQTATNLAIAAIDQQKDKIAGLGSSAFALFLDKLASGDEQEAASIYLRATGSVDEIIEAMDRGTLGVLDAKRKIDKFWADAWDVVKSIAITGAKLLLPLMLAAL
jgi:DNA-directed RNA polymerase beta' subunit